MSYTYKTIVSKAKTCQTSTKKEYKLGVETKWSYYFAKAIIKPKSDVKQISIDKAPSPTGTYISTQISKDAYLKIAKYLVNFVEKKKRLPNYVEYGNYKLRVSIYTELLARILVFYDSNGKLPSKANVNSKIFTKPVEYKNVVYKYFVEKTGKTYKTIDDLLGYVKNNFTYQYYYNDKKSNKQVIDTKSGNCTDLLQFLCNMSEEMGYSWKCIHVKCRSGGGHVYGKFKHPKHTNGKWIIRDIACVADGGSITCVWCKDGTLQAENPSWWMQNLNR